MATGRAEGANPKTESVNPDHDVGRVNLNSHTVSPAPSTVRPVSPQRRSKLAMTPKIIAGFYTGSGKVERKLPKGPAATSTSAPGNTSGDPPFMNPYMPSQHPAASSAPCSSPNASATPAAPNIRVSAGQASAQTAQSMPAEAEEERKNVRQTSHNARNLTPKQIRKMLDDYVIGQDRLKRTLSVALYNHYLRLDANMGPMEHDITDDGSRMSFTGKPSRLRRSRMNMENEDDLHTDDHNMDSNHLLGNAGNILVDKSNVLLVGPTGSGKTLIARTTARILDVPFSMNDATPFTQAGYVGEDVENCIHRLLQNADYDVARAQRGIVFIDEIDKIARRTDSANPNQRDVSGEGVQQGLLRILEGTVVNVNVKPGAKRNSGGGAGSGGSGEVYAVDTSNILFICSGAFIGLEKIIMDRLGTKGSIGFGAHISGKVDMEDPQHLSLLDYTEPDDLIKYGFIPEFVGRLPVIANANQLTKDELVRVLTEPKNALVKQYEEIFRRSEESILQEALYEYPGTDVRCLVVHNADSGSSSSLPTVTVFREGEEHLVEELLRSGVVRTSSSKDATTEKRGASKDPKGRPQIDSRDRRQHHRASYSATFVSTRNAAAGGLPSLRPAPPPPQAEPAVDPPQGFDSTW
ncbi:hypothetical protein HK102_004578 [Quaeritorhiza haematococci]|nr:hypothetical protein HK102_004578 [Quaeritorhiza haematococci]